MLTVVVITALFWPLAGLGATLGWAAIYTVAQIIEDRAGAAAARQGPYMISRSYWSAVLGMALSIGCYGSISVLWAAQGEPWAFVYAAYLLAGSLMHSASSIYANRAALIAVTAPLLVSMAAQPLVAIITGQDQVAWMELIPAVGLVGACAFRLWTGLNSGWQREADLRDDLRTALTRAEAANDAKSAFLATMSHEIRTPLNGVLGIAQAMLIDEDRPVQRERLQVLDESGRALMTVLNDVLDISKIEAGKMELERTAFDLNVLMHQVHDTFRVLASQRDLDLVVNCQAPGVYIGDPARIRQVLSNLVSNALKFTPNGSVEMTARLIDGDVVLAVADTGIGMSDEQTETLFEKFSQADASTTRQYGGTGLGLAICRELVDRMGGSISAESRVGTGSVFTVALTLERAVIAADDIDIVVPAAVRPSASLRVLAAEDNPTNQMVLRALLSALDADVMIVGDGRAAVEAWKTGAWDVVLMDIQMPLLDGPAATREIRALEQASGRARTPIIATTANAMDHQISAYLAAGMDSHVSKPILAETLFSAIETAMVQRPSALAA